MNKALSTQAEKNIAKDVWSAMSGCNLSGLLRFWADTVLPVVNSLDIADRNRHPYHAMMADKLAQLAGDAMGAYWEVSKLINKE